MDHPPKFLDRPLPVDRELTDDDLFGFGPDREEALVLAVEVIAPSSRRLDRSIKRARYESSGVEHYWLVDPVGPSVEAFRLVEGGYQLVAKADAGQRFAVTEPFPIDFDPVELLDE